MEYFIVWAFFCFIVALFTSSTTLGFWPGFFISLILSPIVGFIIYLFYPNKKVVEKRMYKATPISKADELSKLKKLADDGVLNPKEYEAAKRRLLT